MEEADSSLVELSSEQVGIVGKLIAETLEYIGRAASGTYSVVTVLCDLDSRTSHYK
jgi:hypothetical protein